MGVTGIKTTNEAGAAGLVAAPIFSRRDWKLLGLLAGSLFLIATIEVLRATSPAMAAIAVGLNAVTFATCLLAIYGLRRGQRRSASATPAVTPQPPRPQP